MGRCQSDCHTAVADSLAKLVSLLLLPSLLLLLAHIAINSSGECRSIAQICAAQNKAQSKPVTVVASNDKRQLNLPSLKLRLAFWRPWPGTASSLQPPAAASNLRSQPLPQPQCCHQAYLFSCVCRRLPSINVNSFLSKLSMAASKATCCVVRCVTEKEKQREGEEAGREANASGEMKTYEQAICLYLMRLI